METRRLRQKKALHDSPTTANKMFPLSEYSPRAVFCVWQSLPGASLSWPPAARGPVTATPLEEKEATVRRDQWWSRCKHGGGEVSTGKRNDEFHCSVSWQRPFQICCRASNKTASAWLELIKWGPVLIQPIWIVRAWFTGYRQMIYQYDHRRP